MFVPGSSMSPTLLVGDYFLVGTQHTLTLPMRGDVVAFKYPRDPSVIYVKRVIALPGDTVQMRQGFLYINRQLRVREPEGDYLVDDIGSCMALRRYVETLPNRVSYYILKATDDGDMNNTNLYIVPPDHFFAMGDNRDNSADSRFMNGVGFVPQENIVGQVGVVFWAHQLSRIGRRVE